jgi:alpha-D-xyloside xylohydrolase
MMTPQLENLGRFLALVSLSGLIACSGKQPEHRVGFDYGSVTVAPTGGAAVQVRLEIIAPKVIRVTAFPNESVVMPENLMAVKHADGRTPFKMRDENGTVSVSTSDVTAEVSVATGKVTFKDAAGNVLLSEIDGGRTFTPVTVEGQSFFAIRQQFASPADEAFYGLGQHQNAQMNYKGENVELAQHNMDVAIPFVVSSRNYGLLWHNTSITRFGDPREWQPLDATLKVYDAEGKEGGLTAKYSVDGKLVLTRTESRLDYQYIKSLKNLPAEIGKSTNQHITWQGSIEARTSGLHKFSLYASDYHKLFIDGKPVLDAWRQNWNPWYRNFELEMRTGEPHAIRIEWERAGGYLTLLHRDPLPAEEQKNLSLFSELGQAIDYYFVEGANADEVISGYRLVTGKSAMLPKWAYGFWQSRERYKTQDELVGMVKEYRKRNIPLDNIVQDWFYWKEDQWGSHEFDATRYPDPQKMVNDIHALNARVMISVWPKFYPATANFKELDAGGHIYQRNLEQQEKDWVGPGYLSSFYDPYSAEARRIFWRQVEERLGKLGIDAWWLDATEPDPQSNLDMAERKLRMGPTAMGPGAQFFNSFPLMQARAVWEGDRAAHPDRRAFILTRSAFPGLQRYAAATWSGDIASRWSDLHDQISAGVNFSMSGLPNWSFDIGGFALEPRYEKPSAKDLKEWRELNTRWFQFGAFVPLFRSHGQFPYREIHNLAPAGSEEFNSLVYYDKLRYRLLPYIYTIAADTYHHDSTMMRGLVMDFPADPQVRKIADQYLFGPAFLVSPVYEYRARSREVYFPAGASWYDFYTGESVAGGARKGVAAPLGRMPLFVRAGSIIPIGPEIQYSSDKPGAPITLYVYKGRDGRFTLYEDAGTDYGYEKGQFSTIPISYDEAKSELVIGQRAGEFPGMVAKRTFNVRWIGGEAPRGFDPDARPDQVVEYSGAAVTVSEGRKVP